MLDLAPLFTQLTEAGIITDPDTLEPPAVFREDRTDKLFVKDTKGNYVCTSAVNIRQALQLSGVQLTGEAEEDGKIVAQASRLILAHNTVSYAGPIAGCSAGIVEAPDGKLILVTRSCTTVEPKAGPCTTIMDLITNLFGGNGEAVMAFLVFLKLWLCDYRKSLEVGPWKAGLRPAQALMIVGPPNTGKTLIFEVLRPLWGNTIVDPHPYFAGETNFNADHLGATILKIDDSADSLKPGARQKLTQQIKQRVAVPDYRIHPKGRESFAIRTCQRVLILGNMDSLEVLPFVPASFKDKIHVLSAHPSELVGREMSQTDSTAWFEKMRSELAAFAHYLLNEVAIPEHMADRRFGVKAYHDQEILALLEGTEDVCLFMRMVEYALANETDGSSTSSIAVTPVAPRTVKRLTSPDQTFEYQFEGFAKELYALLSQNVDGPLFRALVSHPTRVGKLLEMAQNSLPAKVTRGKLNTGIRQWKVQFTLSKSEADAHARLFKRDVRTF